MLEPGFTPHPGDARAEALSTFGVSAEIVAGRFRGPRCGVTSTVNVI